MEFCIRDYFFNFLLATVVIAQFEYSTVPGCPDQCSCRHVRSYSDHRSEYNSVDVQCNPYAAKFGANLSEVPDFRRIKTLGRPVKIAIEQLNFEYLPALNFRGIKLQSLKLVNNPKLEIIDEQLFYEQSYYFEELALTDLDSLLSLPYDALSELSQLRSLTLKASPKMSQSMEFSMQNLQNLEELSLNGNIFANVLVELPSLRNIKQLQLFNIGSKISSLPSNAMCHLIKLSLLNLGYNNLTEIPAAAYCLKNIHTLSLENNQIRVHDHMPAISQMPKSLQILDLRFNPTYSIPCEVFSLRNLKYFKSAHGILCLHCKSDSARIQLARQHCGSSEQIIPYETKKPYAFRNSHARSTPVPSVSEEILSSDTNELSALRNSYAHSTPVPSGSEEVLSSDPNEPSAFRNSNAHSSRMPSGSEQVLSGSTKKPVALRGSNARSTPTPSGRRHSAAYRTPSSFPKNSTHVLWRHIQPPAGRMSGFPVSNKIFRMPARINVTLLDYNETLRNRSTSSEVTPTAITMTDNETFVNFSTIDEATLAILSNNLTVDRESNEFLPALAKIAATQNPNKPIPVGFVSRNKERFIPAPQLSIINEEGSGDENDPGNGKVPVVPIFLVNHDKSM